MSGRQRRNGEARHIPLPDAAANTGLALMQAQESATARYLDWANDTANAMKLPTPKEGHRWIVNTREKRIDEVPSSQ